MTTETSPTRTADSVRVVIGSTLVTSSESAVFTGLQEERAMVPDPTRGSDATSDNANIIGPNDRYVASVDPTPSTPHDWFRFAADLCHTPLAERVRQLEVPHE